MFHRTLVAFTAAAPLVAFPFRRMLSLLAIQVVVVPSGMRREDVR
jgi:hypothetical protein